MDVDPIDDGPSIQMPVVDVFMAQQQQQHSALLTPPQPPVYGSSLLRQPPPSLPPQPPLVVLSEDDARLCIEMLRSEDLANRVAAANRLDAVATALGSERTRDVRCTIVIFVCASVR